MNGAFVGYFQQAPALLCVERSFNMHHAFDAIDLAADGIVERLSPATHATAVELASLPEQIRGFGPVKARHLERAAERRGVLLARLRDPGATAARRDPIPIKAAA